LIAAVIVAISLFFLWTDILPRYNYTARLKPIIEERMAFFESQNKIAQKIVGLYEKNQKKYTELERLSLIVPPKESLPELLTTIETISSATGNIVQGLVIGKSQSQEDIFNIISLDITTGGQYLDLISLLKHLEKNIRLFDIHTISISTSTVAIAPTFTGEGSLGLSIKATTYFLKSDEEIKQLEDKKRLETAGQRKEEKDE